MVSLHRTIRPERYIRWIRRALADGLFTPVRAATAPGIHGSDRRGRPHARCPRIESAPAHATRSASRVETRAPKLADHDAQLGEVRSPNLDHSELACAQPPAQGLGSDRSRLAETDPRRPARGVVGDHLCSRPRRGDGGRPRARGSRPRGDPALRADQPAATAAGGNRPTPGLPLEMTAEQSIVHEVAATLLVGTVEGVFLIARSPRGAVCWGWPSRVRATRAVKMAVARSRPDSVGSEDPAARPEWVVGSRL